MSVKTVVQLSAEQQAVIAHPLDRPGVVDAGAGTGKTFTIVERVVALLEAGLVRADQVLVLTFGRKAAAELRARIAQRLGETAVQCQTFHAFAWSILSSHVYDTGLSPETAVIEDADAGVEFRAAFDGYLHDATAAACGFPLRRFNRNELRNELFKLRQELTQEGVRIEAFRDRALAAADRFARVSYRELREPRAKSKNGKNYKVIAEVSDAELARQIREEKTRVAAVADIFERYDQRLTERHALTYADILLRAEAALRGSSALREELRARYRCCIVDEYQDTDLAQHRFLEALFGSGLEPVMVVGDVLQSIYSFRGAHPRNVEIFKQAAGALAYPLLENRRSRQEILDLAHHAVLPAHAEAQVLAGRRGHAKQQIVHVSSLWEDESDLKVRYYIPFDQARALEARAIARRICSLLAEGSHVETSDGASERIAPRHIAILSRTKRNVRPVTDALLDARIPFKLVGGVGFYDAPEIRDALAWLRLLADPFDSHAVARALACSAIAASDAMVAALAPRGEYDETSFARRVLTGELDEGDGVAPGARQAAHALREMLDELAPHAALPLLGALRAVYERTGMERHYQTSPDPRAPQARANLEKLEAFARGFAQQHPGAQPADFVAFIDELERIDFDEREADVPAHDAVTISTIHSAKGLEWPIVFVLSIWPELRRGVRLFVDEDGALLYAEGADGSRPFHFLAVDRQADASGHVRRPDKGDGEPDEAEERRLFYVALTRARDQLFLSGLRGKPSKQHAAGKPHRFLSRAYEWLARLGWAHDERIDHVEEPLVWQPPQAHAPARLERSTLVDGSPLTSAAALLMPLSYSLIADYEQCPRRAVYRAVLRVPRVASARWRRRAQRGWETLDAESTDARDATSVAAEDSLLNAGDYGAVLHKALELWALAKKSGSAGGSPDSFVSKASSVLDLRLGEKQARDATTALAQVARELEVWTVIQVEAPFTMDFGSEGKAQLVFGYLDLLARDEDGRACLVDYKTGGALRTAFELQLALYRAAARDVYGVPVERCFVGRVKGDNFTLEPVEPLSDEELHATIDRVRAGLVARDTRPHAGAWCKTCGYRAAPCQDYQRPKRTRDVASVE